jgi:hypothetical protein
MSTLVIHAPYEKVQIENKRSFQNTFASLIGDEYAIPRHLIPLIPPGCKVVLLSKDEEKRAEGKLVKLVARSRTNTGMQRYDVHIENLRMVPYKSEALLRTGVAVI